MRGVALVDVRSPCRSRGLYARALPGRSSMDALSGSMSFRRIAAYSWKEGLRGHFGEVRVAVIGFPVREREFGDLDQEVDVLRGVVLHRRQVVPFQNGDLLEKDRPLGPGAALEDVVPPVVRRHGFLDPGRVAPQVFLRDQSAVSLPRRVGEAALLDKFHDPFRYFSLIERVVGRRQRFPAPPSPFPVFRVHEPGKNPAMSCCT